jgi:hypothetical protein
MVIPVSPPAEPVHETHAPASKGPGEKYCHECRAIISAKAEICPACGVRQPMGDSDPVFQAQRTEQMLARVPEGKGCLTAMMLAFFWLPLILIIAIMAILGANASWDFLTSWYFFGLVLLVLLLVPLVVVAGIVAVVIYLVRES